MNNKEFARSLRQLADFYEDRPNLPQPSTSLCAYMPKSLARETMSSIGNFEKEYNGDYFSALKTIGGLELRFATPRENVCEKVVVGTKLIPRQVLPATAETIIEAHEEEITEWQCHPVTAPANQIEAYGMIEEELVAA